MWKVKRASSLDLPESSQDFPPSKEKKREPGMDKEHSKQEEGQLDFFHDRLLERAQVKNLGNLPPVQLVGELAKILAEIIPLDNSSLTLTDRHALIEGVMDALTGEKGNDSRILLDQSPQGQAKPPNSPDTLLPADSKNSSRWKVMRAQRSEQPGPIQPVTSTPVIAKARVIDEARTESMLDLKVRIHRQLLERINLAVLDTLSRENIASEIGQVITELLDLDGIALNRAERQMLIEDVLDELLGLGPLEPLLKDQTITDILVNGHDTVFVERRGLLERVGTRFQDERHLLRIIQKIVSAVGRRIDESSPFVDARLADGSRVNAIVAPLAIDGSLLSIRKFAKIPISMEIMVEYGSIPAKVAIVLKAVVEARLNVIISGGTGSGKTTLLNALSSFIDEHERIVTIEDSAELQLQQEHVARLETRPPNMEGRGEVTQRDLVKNALRMRPDRIILGECRAGEAFDMLQAMNTGHDGSMTTVHANTPRDALSRIEQMIGMSGIDIPTKSTRAQIASAINVVVQIARLSDGRRKLVSLSELTGMEGDVITMQEIYRFTMTGRDEAGNVTGQFEATGIRPKFAAKLAAHGVQLDASLFNPGADLGAP